MEKNAQNLVVERLEACNVDLHSVASYPLGDISVGEHVLHVYAQKELSPFDALLLLDDHDLTGHKLWEGARLLLHYLNANSQLVSSKRVLELGCGCGIVGVFASVLGAREVLLTDGNAGLQSLVHTNVTANNVAGCSFATLEWSVHGLLPASLGAELFDVCLAADVIYDPEVVVPLLHTAKRSLALSGTFVLAFVRRCMGDVQGLILQTAEQLHLHARIRSCSELLEAQLWAKELEAADTCIYEFTLEA